jgi:hypothetical protein
MDKIIPILPCQSIKEQVAFYKNLGFEIIEMYTSPSPYAVMQYSALEMHFYGSKKTLPSENPNMCYIKVDDVDNIYEIFTSNYKKNTGKIPRSGIPRISKLKDLTYDRRFTVTDAGGNTIYIGSRNTKLPADKNFFRTIKSGEYAEKFETLYDLIYSKEDSKVAFSMLAKHFPADISSINLEEIDLAKVLLVALDINIQHNNVIDEGINKKLNKLFNIYKIENDNWKKILQKYNEIIKNE